MPVHPGIKKKEALGRSAGGFTTKLHALVDALGNPLLFLATPGQEHDVNQAENLLKNYKETTVIADKGYDSQTLINKLKKKDIASVIPPRKNSLNPRKYDKHLYKERNLIECFFGKIKQFRRVFSRFDKSIKAFLSFVNFAAAIIWLR